MNNKLQNLIFHIITIILVASIFSIELVRDHFILCLISMLLSLIFCVYIHELGHVFFGSINGFKMLYFRMFFMSWEKINGKTKFSVNSIKEYLGICSMIPPPRITQSIFIMYLAGGSIFNLLSGLIAVVIAAIITNESLISVLMTFATVSLIMAIVNCFRFNSDGKLMFWLARDGKRADNIMKQVKNMSRLAKGIRPRCIEPSAISTDEPLKPEEFYLIFDDYCHYLDSNDFEMMEKTIAILEENADGLSHDFLQSVYKEFVYFYSAVNKNPQKALGYYNKIRRLLNKDNNINGLRIKAAYELYVTGNVQKANRYADKFFLILNEYTIKGKLTMERDLINKMFEK